MSKRACTFTAIGLITVGWLALQPAGESVRPAEVSSPAFMENVVLQAYDAKARVLQVKAARAYPSQKRLGFFRTALVPTIALEDVVIERAGADGRPEQVRQAHATIDWVSKSVRVLRE